MKTKEEMRAAIDLCVHKGLVSKEEMKVSTEKEKVRLLAKCMLRADLYWRAHPEEKPKGMTEG